MTALQAADTDALAVLAYTLSDRQHDALASLPSMPGRYQVGWRSGLSAVAESALIDLGLIEQRWTWASTTRPDTGITERGIAVRQILAHDAQGIAR